VAINILKVTTALIFRTQGGSKLFGSTGNHLKYCMVKYPRMPPLKFHLLENLKLSLPTSGMI
jgi:hypothetical protein